MQIVRTGFVVLAALVAPISATPTALAAPASPPASHVAAQRPARTLVGAEDSEFFSGLGAAFYTFNLQSGRYEIDVFALYSSLNDPSGSGECLFGAYIDGVQTPVHISLSVPVPIVDPVPFHITPIVSLAAGEYKLDVLPLTDCEWRVTILDLKPVAPAIDILAVRSYLIHGRTFTPTNVVPMGQPTDFSVFYSLAGPPAGPLAGKVTIRESAGPAQTYHLYAAKTETKQFYVGILFSRQGHDVPGPAVATFTVTAGALHASRALHFTLTG
jgi:hypothetical protein